MAPQLHRRRFWPSIVVRFTAAVHLAPEHQLAGTGSVCRPAERCIAQRRVALDSIWQKPFVLLADGIEFRDPRARTRIVERRGPISELETRADSLVPTREKLKLYNIQRFVEVIGGSGNARHIVEVHKAGFIESARTELEADAICKTGNEIFRQHIRSRYRWMLRGQYDY